MDRRANIYVSDQCPVPQGIKTLLAINGIQYVEIDVSKDGPLRELVCGRTGRRNLPVVELEGMFADGPNVVAVAHALRLSLLVTRPDLPNACC